MIDIGIARCTWTAFNTMKGTEIILQSDSGVNLLYDLKSNLEKHTGVMVPDPVV